MLMDKTNGSSHIFKDKPPESSNISGLVTQEGHEKSDLNVVAQEAKVQEAKDTKSLYRSQGQTQVQKDTVRDPDHVHEDTCQKFVKDADDPPNPGDQEAQDHKAAQVGSPRKCSTWA